MFAQIFINNSEYLNSKHETVNFSNRPQQRPVKSLTRSSDKDAGARNSYNSDWKDRNWRKLKGDAKNDDVEKRWREISKVGGVEEVYLLSCPPITQSLVNIRVRNKSRVQVGETDLDGSSDLLHISRTDMRERSKSALSVDTDTRTDMVRHDLGDNGAKLGWTMLYNSDDKVGKSKEVGRKD